MCYQVRFIIRSVKCMVTMWWVMAWLGNGFGCSMKDERMHNEARSGRPSSVNDDLVRKINERVYDDRRFTISDLSLHFPQIPKTLLYDIVSSHLVRRRPHSMRVHKNFCSAKISAPIMAANMWKNRLKNVESDNNKILYETLLDIFQQRNGTYFLNKPRTMRYQSKTTKLYYVYYLLGQHVSILIESSSGPSTIQILP